MKRAEVRQVDAIAIQRYGISGLVLMENAGRGAAEQIANFASGYFASGYFASGSGCRTRVCLLCGTGNNGGDGYVIARHLDLAGYEVAIVSLVPLERLSGDATTNAKIADKAGLSIVVASTKEMLEQSIPDDAVIVDCLLGTGASGEPRGLYADAIQIANQRSGPRIAIDIPTGLDCDSGEPSKATFQAEMTITFVAEKDGFANEKSKPYVGRIAVVGIGVPRRLLDEFGVAS